MQQKYKTILADPPWSYSNKRTGGSMKSGSAAKYPTLSLDEICNLEIDGEHIQHIGDKDSLLLLWVPSPLIQYGLDTMRSWGYTHKMAIYWVKTDKRPGMGFWFRNKVEICLLGKRGKITPFRSNNSNVIYANTGQHSEKPQEFIDLIEPEINKYGLNPKIELFSRHIRDGWDGWGLEYPGNTTRASDAQV